MPELSPANLNIMGTTIRGAVPLSAQNPSLSELSPDHRVIHLDIYRLSGDRNAP